MIITHSKHIVRNLKHDYFVNLEGMTEEQWLNREIKATNIEEFREYASGLFRAIQDRINSNKEKKSS
jgi:hypothetical protein